MKGLKKFKFTFTIESFYLKAFSEYVGFWCLSEEPERLCIFNEL